MDVGMSLVLDLLRFGAALAVVLGHLSQRYFAAGSLGMEHLATSSVGFFFVLSGFVIAFTLDRRPSTPREYAVARLARMYSVAVPALALTFVLDTIGRISNPGYYRFWADGFLHPLKSGVLSLLFLNEAHGHEIRFMTNSPYWSLGFEVPYYVAFGVMVFARGWLRWALLGACLVIWGLPVLALFPLWLGGVALYRLLKRGSVSKRAGMLALAATPIFVITAEPLTGLWDHARVAAGESKTLAGTWFVATFEGRAGHLPLLIVGGVVTACLILAASAFREELAIRLRSAARPIRELASCTFSLYLFHFPILCLGGSLGVYDRSSSLHHLLLLAATLGSCHLLSKVTEGRKGIWARWLERAIPGKKEGANVF
jgi:peptidoglycan/LPS O-acetylase OafA/YrhL